MIYFDKQHNAYGDELSIIGKDIIYTCEDTLWQDFNDNEGKYIWQDDEIVPNPDWQEIQRQKEAERVANLTCTKRVFALMLEQLGFSYYNQIQPLINANERARMEWELCVELQRKNPLLDIVASEIGVTSEQLDKLFKFANDEINQEEFLGV